MPAAVVANGGFDVLGNDRQVVLQKFMHRLAVKLRMFGNGGVEVVHVCSVMLAVMNLHRLFVDVRLQSVGRKRQGGKLIGHGSLLRAELELKFTSFKRRA